jgi:hypothetical protein
MTTMIDLGRLDIPRAPRARQPMIYGGPPLFGPRSARALARKFGRALVIDEGEATKRLNGLEMPFRVLAAIRAAGSDGEYFQYAKAIAQHSAALVELLCGTAPREGLHPPGFVTVAAREALYHLGTPPELSPDDMLDATDAAARGVVLLHHAARHAAGRWARLMGDDNRNPGKPPVRQLVESLAALYAEAFDVEPLRQPSATSPVVAFCHFVATTMYRRMARYYSPPLPVELLELRGLDARKVAEFLRPARAKRRGKGGIKAA